MPISIKQRSDLRLSMITPKRIIIKYYKFVYYEFIINHCKNKSNTFTLIAAHEEKILGRIAKRAPPKSLSGALFALLIYWKSASDASVSFCTASSPPKRSA